MATYTYFLSEQGVTPELKQGCILVFDIYFHLVMTNSSVWKTNIFLFITHTIVFKTHEVLFWSNTVAWKTNIAWYWTFEAIFETKIEGCKDN